MNFPARSCQALAGAARDAAPIGRPPWENPTGASDGKLSAPQRRWFRMTLKTVGNLEAMAQCRSFPKTPGPEGKGGSRNSGVKAFAAPDVTNAGWTDLQNPDSRCGDLGPQFEVQNFHFVRQKEKAAQAGSSRYIPHTSQQGNANELLEESAP
jgi:hypothetical protein